MDDTGIAVQEVESYEDAVGNTLEPGVGRQLLALKELTQFF